MKQNINFLITNIILSTTGSFTIDDMYIKINNYNLDEEISKNTIKKQ